MNSVQEDLNAKAAADDEAIIALAQTASDEEVSAMADELADENADYIKNIASEKLTEIDDMVAAYIGSLL